MTSLQTNNSCVYWQYDRVAGAWKKSTHSFWDSKMYHFHKCHIFMRWGQYLDRDHFIHFNPITKHRNITAADLQS